MRDTDFYLASTEGYDLDEPRHCRCVKRLKSESRADLLLVEIDPPIIGQKFGLGGRDIDVVVLATRHKGVSLFPIAEWPVYVHVARILAANPRALDTVHDGDLQSIAWAELYQTEEAARNK